MSSVQVLPGVRSVSLASITPLGGARWEGGFAAEGVAAPSKESERGADMNAVGPRYFETVGIPLVLGREFGPEDDPPVVPDPPEDMRAMRGPQPEAPGLRRLIVSEGFAKKYLAPGSPLGQRVSLTDEYDATRAYEVIGVARDAHYFGLREAAEPMLYVSSWRTGPPRKSLCVRTDGSAVGLTDAIRRAVSAVDPAVPLLDAKTIEDRLDTDLVRERLMASVAGFFGLLALLLASVGVYGVISYLVTRRTREIGIRLALGAQRSSVLRLVLFDAGLLVGIGAVVGVGAASTLGRLVQALLYGITPSDAPTVATSVLVLLVVTALAVLVPARRALAIEPNEALRCE
jgi:predicted permease